MVRNIRHDRSKSGFVSGGVLLALTALASEAAWPQSLSECASIENPEERLSCYDGLATTPAAAPATTPTVSSAGSAAEDAADEPKVPGVASYDDIFGLENEAGNQGRQEVQSPIANNFDGWSGRTVFRLENGQVWVQQDQNSRLTWRGGPHPMATIKRKSFNSYLLKVEGVNKSVRVRRIE